MSPLLEIYKEILHAVGCKVLTDGSIVYKSVTGGENTDVNIQIGKKVKKLVLPTKELMRNGEWDELVAFHPGAENIFSGQSEVFNWLSMRVAGVLHDNIQILVGSIMLLGRSEELRGKLNMSQMELLREFGDMDAASDKLLLDICKKSTQICGKYPLLSVKMDRSGKIDDETFSRTCTLIPHVISNPTKMCGVTPTSIKSGKTVRAIYERVFPSVRAYGSNSVEAPYLYSLLDLFYNTSVHLNGVKAVLGKYVDMAEMPTKWYEKSKDIGKLTKIHLNHPLTGNTGVTLRHANQHIEPDVIDAEMEEVVPNQPTVHTAPQIVATTPRGVPIYSDPAVAKLGLRRPDEAMLHSIPPPPQSIPTPDIHQIHQPHHVYMPPVQQQPVTIAQMVNAYTAPQQLPPDYDQNPYRRPTVGYEPMQQQRPAMFTNQQFQQVPSRPIQAPQTTGSPYGTRGLLV